MLRCWENILGESVCEGSDLHQLNINIEYHHLGWELLTGIVKISE